MSSDVHGDNPAADLAKLVVDALPDLTVEQYQKIMESLVMYILRRDHKTFDAGVEVGKEIILGDLEPGEEG